MKDDTGSDLSRALAGVLLSSLQQLAAAGEVEAACRFAGDSCAILRTEDPRTWQRFNALLHRLTQQADRGVT